MAAWSLRQQGRRPVKFRSSLFKGLQGSRGGSAPRSPVATGETLFRREPFSLLLSFCDRKRKKEALRPMPRAAPWTRGGGSFGDKRRQPFGAEKPDGPVPGCARAVHQKHASGMFLRAGKRALGFVLAGARLVSGVHFLAALISFAYLAGGHMGDRSLRHGCPLRKPWRCGKIEPSKQGGFPYGPKGRGNPEKQRSCGIYEIRHRGTAQRGQKHPL